MSGAAIKPKRGVIYVGHIPHGFYEDQMKGFFSQYGKVTNIRLARSKRTGNSKGYGFVEFLDQGVAEIVAATMNGYIFFGRRLVVEVVPKEKLHPATFKGIQRPWTNWTRLHTNHHNRSRTAEEHRKRVAKQKRKRRVKQRKLEAMGIDYKFIDDEEEQEPERQREKKDEEEPAKQEKQQQQKKKRKKKKRRK